MIAATALANGLPLYTCNPADFADIDGLDVIAVPVPNPCAHAKPHARPISARDPRGRHSIGVLPVLARGQSLVSMFGPKGFETAAKVLAAGHAANRRRSTEG